MDLQPSSNSREEMNQNGKTAVAADDKKPPRPQPDHAEKCPRCDSGNTKFCYYNNYSLTQPRYFCKACRRYWTKGGTLRNVPVGGGCRKNRRSAKRAFNNHHNLLVHSHNQMVNNDNNNNVMLSSSTNLKYLPDHSNFSSPLRYEDPGTCDGLSLAFGTLQRQSNVHHLGLEFGPQNSILGHQLIRTSGANDMGFFSNFFEPETTKSFNNSQSLYNNYGADQPLPLSNEDWSLSNMASKGFNEVKQEMNGGDVNGNRILSGLPWPVDNNNNDGVVGQESSEKNNIYNYNYYNTEGCYEVEGGGGRSERWSNSNNNSGLVATGGSSWPNLINTTALII